VTATTAPRELTRRRSLRAPDWAAELPPWLRWGAFLLVLCVASVAFRSMDLNGQYWMDEGITVGISSHPLTAIPGVLRMDGSPPLFYLLLHVWMSLFGTSEIATHSLTLLIGTLCVPLGFWAGWSLFGKRAGVIAAVLFAFNGFITEYGVETRMYVLMTLLGLLGTVGFLQGFVNRRRGYVVLFGASLALMLYTHAWALFFGGASVIGVFFLWRTNDERRRAGLRRCRHPLPALAAHIPVAISPHGGAVGHHPAFRRPGAAVAQHHGR
jgi:mannosyltransferase